MSEKIKVSMNPHVRSKVTTSNIMFAVIIALLPATGFGIYNFGLDALFLVLVTVITSVLTELIFELITKRKSTILDLSAVVTGLLLGLNLPVSVPLWMGALGSVFAILVVKMLFGGIGQNIMNPALGGRCFLVISFATYMTNFDCDAYSGATPLTLLKSGEPYDLLDMVIGKTGGTIGETSVLAILLGASFLIALGVIDLRIPGTYLVTFVIFIVLFGGNGFDLNYIAGQLSGGGLMLGAFFMATDYASSPITKRGKIVYGILLGLLTGTFRIFGSTAEGVSFAIVIGNLVVPLIEKITRPKAFGMGGEKA